MKVEIEHEYKQRHGASLRDRLFANVHRLSELGSRFAPLSNLPTALPGARIVLEKALGIARERSLPAFRTESLHDWFDARGGARIDPAAAERTALLFPDTYTTYNKPEAGKAAVRALEAAGVRVDVPEDTTGSGRPPYSKGLVEKARKDARRNVAALAPEVREGRDVVVVEPSDAVMLQHDYFDLLDGDDVATVAANTYGALEYIDAFDLDDRMPLDAPDDHLTYHGHCHQKASKKDHHAVGVLRRAGYRVDPLDSACCGMAGTFGYEAEHYSMSQAVGSILFDQVDESDGETMVAPGASCRTQLGDEYGDRVPHPVEKLAAALD